MMPLLLAGSILAFSASSRADDMSGVLVGIDARENSSYGYLGVTHHFGQNILGDGVIGRVVGFAGKYEYLTPAVVGGEVKADYSALEVLAGYQKTFDAFTLRGYLGAEYEGNHLSPDNQFDRNRGDHWGAKVRGEFETDFAAPNYANVIATYSTARDRYWVRARAGRDFSGYVVGPEIIATGDRMFNEERLGVFVNFRNLLPALLSVSAGEARTDGNSTGHTPYVTMEVSTTF
ncbi:MAG: cellulose biosynthesis protein BcsS [Bacteroidota bacterium]